MQILIRKWKSKCSSSSVLPKILWMLSRVRPLWKKGHFRITRDHYIVRVGGQVPLVLRLMCCTLEEPSFSSHKLQKTYLSLESWTTNVFLTSLARVMRGLLPRKEIRSCQWLLFLLPNLLSTRWLVQSSSKYSIKNGIGICQRNTFCLKDAQLYVSSWEK